MGADDPGLRLQTLKCGHPTKYSVNPYITATSI